MARTRAEIRTLVQAHTGRSDKTTLINSLCDSALKYALMEHDFQRATQRTSAETEITEDATEVDFSAYSPSVYKIVTAKIIDTSDEQSAFLPLKNRQWWDRFVVNSEENSTGWPSVAIHEGDALKFNCPCEADKKLRLLYTYIPTFAGSDATECPVPTLDLFVEYFVTANVFFSIGDLEKFGWWNNRAIGTNPERPGGELARAIRADDKEVGRTLNADAGSGFKAGGLVTNLSEWQESGGTWALVDLGTRRSWY
jgi:hypothetical protein